MRELTFGKFESRKELETYVIESSLEGKQLQTHIARAAGISVGTLNKIMRDYHKRNKKNISSIQ